MTDDERRATAIRLLDDWLKAEITARAFERYMVDRPHILNAGNVCRAEADNLREDILMLMGVDDSSAAELELNDDEPEVDPSPRDTEGDLRFHDPEGKA